MTCKSEQSGSNLIYLDNLLEYFNYIKSIDCYKYQDFSRILNNYKYYISKYNVIFPWETMWVHDDLDIFIANTIISYIIQNKEFEIDEDYNIIIYNPEDLTVDEKKELQKFAENCRYNINFE